MILGMKELSEALLLNDNDENARKLKHLARDKITTRPSEEITKEELLGLLELFNATYCCDAFSISKTEQDYVITGRRAYAVKHLYYAFTLTCNAKKLVNVFMSNLSCTYDALVSELDNYESHFDVS